MTERQLHDTVSLFRISKRQAPFQTGLVAMSTDGVQPILSAVLLALFPRLVC